MATLLLGTVGDLLFSVEWVMIGGRILLILDLSGIGMDTSNDAGKYK